MTKIWKDENGMQIPANRITASEKLREKAADKLLAKAQKLSNQLQAFKDEFSQHSEAVYKAVMYENNVNTDERKGNFTFYNFDRSIKVETDVNERIVFDDALIAVAKEHFNSFLSSGTNNVDEMIQEMITDAFSTSRGRLDAKKVMGLLKYRGRVQESKYPKFHAALDAIESSIRRPESKVYYRISMRTQSGEYEAINLNFSAL